MKLRFPRGGRTVGLPVKKRSRLFAGAPALQSDRPTRVYSLLLPPNSNATRR